LQNGFFKFGLFDWQLIRPSVAVSVTVGVFGGEGLFFFMGIVKHKKEFDVSFWLRREDKVPAFF
jgi:hypothetical protein